MAKEFKEWDKAFNKDQIQSMRNLWLYIDDPLTDDRGSIEDFNGWAYYEEIEVWGNSEIRHAVYEADDAKEWQCIRVAMKGLSTIEKLTILANLRQVYPQQVWKIRIDNYLGALRRGGQLDEDYKIRK